MAKYIILCNYCNWKSVSDLDNINIKKLNNDTLSSQKYRCPKCGRAITPRKFSDPQKDLENKQEEKKIEQENKQWLQQHIDFQVSFLKEKKEDE